MAESVNDRIAGLIAPLIEERENLARLRAELIQRREALDAELVKVDRILRAAGYVEEKPAKKKAVMLPSASPQRQAAVYDVLRTSGAKMTQDEIGQALHVATSSVNSALQHLRAAGTVRLAGYRGNAKLYALANGDGPQEPPSYEKQQNVPTEVVREEVLAAMEQVGPEGANVTRIGELAGRHSSTVANHVRALQEEGTVTAVRTELSSRGRPMTIYALTRVLEVAHG